MEGWVTATFRFEWISSEVRRSYTWKKLAENQPKIGNQATNQSRVYAPFFGPLFRPNFEVQNGPESYLRSKLLRSKLLRRNFFWINQKIPMTRTRSTTIARYVTVEEDELGFQRSRTTRSPSNKKTTKPRHIDGIWTLWYRWELFTSTKSCLY